MSSQHCQLSPTYTLYNVLTALPTVPNTYTLQCPHSTANCPQHIHFTMSSQHCQLSPTHTLYNVLTALPTVPNTYTLQCPHSTANCPQHIHFTMSSQHCQLSPTHTLKWPGHSLVQMSVHLFICHPSGVAKTVTTQPNSFIHIVA